MVEPTDKCQRHVVALPHTHCRRVAAVERQTNSGRHVLLCKKCDASFGHIVGKKVEFKNVASFGPEYN